MLTLCWMELALVLEPHRGSTWQARNRGARQHLDVVAAFLCNLSLRRNHRGRCFHVCMREQIAARVIRELIEWVPSTVKKTKIRRAGFYDETLLRTRPRA
jgi:hypothetical protein